jgi:hypothetical protein
MFYMELKYDSFCWGKYSLRIKEAEMNIWD